MPASEQLLTNLRQTLLSCAPVDSDNGLRALFVDPRLQPWRHLLPEGDSPAGRVDGLLLLLHDRQDEHEASALALFLEVAAAQLSPDDACRQRLLALVEPVRSAAAASPDGLFPQLEAARRRSGDVYDLSGDFRGAVINIQSTIVQAAEVRELEGLPPEPGDPPFQGLQPFTAADADRFFGRERLTARLANRLQPAQPHQARFLAVIGASGSGKSSLVRAGLIPALRRGQRLADGSLPPSGSAAWTVRIFTPTAHPLESLATALLADSETLSELAALTRELEAEPDTLGLAARRLVSQEESGHLLLVVDQFEELFTQCRQPEERQAFVDALLAAVDPARGRPVTVLIVLRADFYAHCAQYDGLRELLSQQQEYIGAMSRAELFDAIVKPAALGDWRIQEGLVELMLDEVGNEPGALPLLSHALLETWQRRRGRTMTLSGYNEAGGVRGAIAQTAETVFSQRLTTGQQQVARAIFLRLTEVGEVHGDEGATPDTRRRVPLAELLSSAHDDETVAAVLEILSSARLVTTGLLPAANTRVVEVAHEALIREWPTLRQWLDANREHLLRQRDLTDAAYTWESLGRDDGALFRGARLEQALAWLAEAPEPLSLLEQEFVAASQALAAREAAERRRQARAALVQRALAFVAVALIAVIVFLVARQAGWFLGPMDGFFNVAVANFLVVDEAGALVDASSAAGEQLGDWAFAALENEFAANESLQIRRVTFGEVRAAQAGPSAEAAFAGLETPADLAARVNAHMVVYGVIEQPQSRFSRFSLQFYLAPRLDYTFAELEGQHSLGDPLPFAPEDLALARPQLEAEAAATGHIALGLIQELLHEPEEALASFQAAADAVSRSQQGRPVVHFLIGQQYLYLAEDDQRAVDPRDDLEEAAASLERALALDPAYTQAQTVLGGVYNFHAQLLLQQDGGSPEPAVVAEAIALAAQARDTYATALQSDQERPGDRSARLPLTGIAHLGRGNSLRVLSFAHYLQSDLPQAVDLAQQSLAALVQAEQALSGTTEHRLLAQTYEARGLAELWDAFLHDNDPAGYRRAAAYFEKCVAQAAELPLDRFLQEDIVAQRCTPGLAEAEGRLGEAP